MAAKLVASACLCALAATTYGGAPSVAPAPWRSVAVDAALPFAVGGEGGHASLATTIGETRWRLMAHWTSGEGRSELHVGLARQRRRS